MLQPIDHITHAHIARWYAKQIWSTDEKELIYWKWSGNISCCFCFCRCHKSAMHRIYPWICPNKHRIALQWSHTAIDNKTSTVLKIYTYVRVYRRTVIISKQMKFVCVSFRSDLPHVDQVFGHFVQAREDANSNNNLKNRNISVKYLLCS